MQPRIQILTPVVFSDRKSAKGTAYRAADVQGILHKEDGTQHVFSLLLMAPRGEKGTDLAPGMYEAQSDLRVNMSDRMRLGYEITGFTAVVEAEKAPSVRRAA